MTLRLLRNLYLGLRWLGVRLMGLVRCTCMRNADDIDKVLVFDPYCLYHRGVGTMGPNLLRNTRHNKPRKES